MRDLNRDSSGSSLLLFYGDENLTNGQYYNGFTPRTITERCLGHDKDALRQKMLEHETIFKNQVHELHRLYRIQRDMMEEFKRKELHKHWASIEPSSSSSLQKSQMPSKDARYWHTAVIPLLNSGYSRASMSGFEIVNSPLSCTKGNETQAGPFQLQDRRTSKDSDALDSRPSKVRKKLFDLEYPADKYIHTEAGEQLPDNEVSGVLSYVSIGDQKIEPRSSMKFSFGDVGMTDFYRDVSTSGSHLRGSGGLADLNEPIQVEDVTAPSSVGFIGHTSSHGEDKGINQFAKGNAQVLGVPGGTIYSHNGSLINSSIESNGNERGWLSHMREAGASKSNPICVTQGLQQNKLPIPCQSAQVLPNQVYHRQGIYTPGYSREDLWRDGPDRGLEPLAACHTRGPYTSINLNGVANSWFHSISSWAKPTNSFSQKLTKFQSSLSSAAGLHPHVQSQETFGDKGQVNVSSRLNPRSENESTTRNGVHHGSSSGSKELQVHLPLSSFDYLNSIRYSNIVSDRRTDPGFEKFPIGCNGVDLKPAIDINLNEVLPKTSSSEVVPLQHLINGKIKPDDQWTPLPWLKPKLGYKNEVADARPELSRDLGCLQASVGYKTEVVSDLNQTFIPNVMFTPNDHKIGAKKEISGTQNIKKILGFSIFEPNACVFESSDHVSNSTTFDFTPEGKKVKDERKNRMIDINLACESDEPIAAELVVEKEKSREATGIRHHIDLNCSISEDEDPPSPSIASNNHCGEIIRDIDLEAPVLDCEDDNTPSEEHMQHEASLRSLEHKPEKIQDEVIRNAAETIFSISTNSHQVHMDYGIFHPSETTFSELLIWFVNVMSSHAAELDNKSGTDSRVGDPAPCDDLCEEIDEFEAMTLQLAETKEEDYMPKPLVPEVEKVEEKAGSNRTRRGQTRRGRQRRDFQRDILPGLTSLSRHEVTEDLQTFGGLMRATGHSWNSGLTRNGTRYGGARGRRRRAIESFPTAISTPVSVPLIEQLSCIEARLEDGSLTGWGKTTRRPRRQRCPAGNLPSVPLI